MNSFGNAQRIMSAYILLSLYVCYCFATKSGHSCYVINIDDIQIYDYNRNSHISIRRLSSRHHTDVDDDGRKNGLDIF